MGPQWEPKGAEGGRGPPNRHDFSDRILRVPPLGAQDAPKTFPKGPKTVIYLYPPSKSKYGKPSQNQTEAHKNQIKRATQDKHRKPTSMAPKNIIDKIITQQTHGKKDTLNIKH